MIVTTIIARATSIVEVPRTPPSIDVELVEDETATRIRENVCVSVPIISYLNCCNVCIKRK